MSKRKKKQLLKKGLKKIVSSDEESDVSYSDSDNDGDSNDDYDDEYDDDEDSEDLLTSFDKVVKKTKLSNTNPEKAKLSNHRHVWSTEQSKKKKKQAKNK